MKPFVERNVETLSALVERSSRVAIVTHTHPDGDAMGSSLALREVLRSLGKRVSVIVPDSVPDTLAFILPDDAQQCVIAASEDFRSARAELVEADLLFCLDLNAFRRAEGLEDVLMNLSCPKVLIDHHLGPDEASFDLVFSETEISSASELLFWLLLETERYAGDASALPKAAARCMMAGMTTDTNNFANSVFPSTLSMASKLLEAGVDRDEIVAAIYNNYRENRFRLMGYLLSEKLTITPDGVAYMVLSSEEIERFDIREGDTEAFVNIPLGIAGVRMSIFLKQQDGRFRVSIRSKKGTSANLCAREYFNGGGHEQAAGGRLGVPSEVSGPEAAAAYIETVTRKFFSDNE